MLLLIFLFNSSKAFSDISGNWGGWGLWNYQGSGTNCFDVNFQFKENKQELRRTSGKLECYYITMAEEPVTLVKDGQSLIREGVIVGIFDENKYEWFEQYSSEVKIKVTVRRDGTRMEYAEEWVEKGNHILYEIKAHLKSGKSNF